MLFNSLPFLYGFLPLTYLVFWRLRTKRSRYAWLTVTGYVFYSFWDYRFCALMATSTLVSYLAGLGLRAWDDPRRRRLCLIAPVTIDLCLLGFFKYAGFAMANANRLGELLHLPIYLSGPTIILPVGISFYTFHTITYIVDSYRRAITPTRDLLEFSCYVSLFSQLVAGPIVRFKQIERDLENIDHGDRGRGWAPGWSLFTLGMIKKVLIADTIAAAVNPTLAQYATLSTGGAWLCMLGYTYQIYFDFSGYSDMAVGLGSLFGIGIPRNFNSPYRALDIADFWRRWHISLSTCLRDYLYIPLGGSRGGGPALADVPQPDDHDAAGRVVARRELDLRRLGRLSRRAARRLPPGGEPLLGSAPGPRAARGHVLPRRPGLGLLPRLELPDGREPARHDVLLDRRTAAGGR